MTQDISAIADTQAEATIIGTLIYHPEFILQFDYMQPGYFSDTINGCLYWGIRELITSGVDKIDAINITNILNSNAAVKKKIEEYNLSDLTDFIDTAQYVVRDTPEELKLLIDRVLTLSFKRELSREINQVQKKCYDPDVDLNALNEVVNTKINGLTEKYLVTEDIQPFKNKVDDIWQTIKDRRNDNGLSGIPFKFPLLNEYVTMEPGEVVLISARMKRGKSALALNQAIHSLKNGIGVLYYDTEMSDVNFMERMISNLTKIPIKLIKNGQYTEEQADIIKRCMDYIKSLNFYHVYAPQPDEEELYSIVKLLQYRANIGLVIYDYIKSNSDADTGVTANILGKKCNTLKNKIAGELNIPVLAFAQRSRINLLADSDQIERYLSTSILWAEKSADELEKYGIGTGNYKLQVQLNRNGAQMEENEWIDAVFKGDTMQIFQAKEQHNPELADQTPFDEEQ